MKPKFIGLLCLIFPLLGLTGDDSGAPQFTSTPVTTVKESEQYQYIMDAEDPDGDGFFFKANQLPEWLKFDVGDEPVVTTILSSDNGDEVGKFLAGDDLGNIYIMGKLSATSSWHYIYKLSPSGEFTSIEVEKLDRKHVSPRGLTIGPDGNLYITSRGEIVKITPDGQPSVVPRTVVDGKHWKNPHGLAFDSQGNIYVADPGTYNLYKITPEGEQSVLAGIGEVPHNGTLFFTEFLDGFHSLEYVAIDKDDNIFVTGIDENRVFKVHHDGTIELFAGGGGYGDTTGETEGRLHRLREPQGITTDDDGNVYVVDNNNRVKRISPDGRVITNIAGTGYFPSKPNYSLDGVGTEAGIVRPVSIAFDSKGVLYVTEAGGYPGNIDKLRRLSGGALKGSPKGYPGVHDVSVEVFDGNGNSSTQDFQITVTDDVRPTVVDILRQDPLEFALTGSEATFRVIYSEAVTGVDVSDFYIKSGNATGTISSVTMVDNKTYDVKVTGIEKRKSLNLEFIAFSSEDLQGNPLGSLRVSGKEEIYIGPNAGPEFTSTPITELTQGEEYTYEITIDEPEGDKVSISATKLPTWMTLESQYQGGTESVSPSGPVSVAVDGTGTVHIGTFASDFASVVKLDIALQADTLAGGTPGFANGIGTNAAFRGPMALAFHSDGSIYMADNSNRAIRKLDATGEVTTVLGKGPTNQIPNLVDGSLNVASIANPRSIVFDGDGNLYYSDYDYHSIRKISVDGQVSTFAGSASMESGHAEGQGQLARFNNPEGMVTDAAGNIYVCDRTNHRIRKITPSGLVSTFAGSGTPGSDDGTGAEAEFYLPTGISMDQLGNFFVADRGNKRIRKISPAGVVTTLDLTGTNLKSPEGVAIGSNGDLYVIDDGLKRYRPATGKITGTAIGAAAFSEVNLLVEDQYGASATQSWVISIPDPTPPVFTSDQAVSVEENITEVAYTATADDLAVLTFSLGTGKDESLFTIDGGTGEVKFVSPPNFEDPTDANTDNDYELEVMVTDGNHQVSLDVTITVTNANDPPEFTSTPITEASDYGLYNYTFTVTDLENGALTLSAETLPDWVSMIPNLNGTVETAFGTGSPGNAGTRAHNVEFLAPIDVAVQANGNVFVVDIGSENVKLMMPNESLLTVDYNGAKPLGVTVDDSNNLFASFGHAVVLFENPNVIYGKSDESGETNGHTTNARFNGPAGVTHDSEGNIYVADRNNHSIRKIDTNGQVTTIAGTGEAGYADGKGTAAVFNTPIDVAVDSKGNLYVTDFANNRIRKIDTELNVTTVAGSGELGFTNGLAIEAKLRGPYGIAIDANDYVYFSEYGNHSIRVLQADTWLNTFAGNGTKGFQNGSGGSATFNQPAGLDFDLEGNLLVADVGNYVIRRIGAVVTGGQLFGDPKGAEGPFPVSLKVSDPEGNTDVQEFEIGIVDLSGPQLVSIKRQEPANQKLSNATATFRVTFHEAVGSISKDDFELTDSEAGEISALTMVSDEVYDVTVIKIKDNATVALKIVEGHGITDIVNNRLDRQLGANDGVETYTGPDPLRLFSIRRQDPTGEKLTGSTATFRVTFTEALSAIEASDFILTSPTAGEVSSLEYVSDGVYDLTISKIKPGVTIALAISPDHGLKDHDDNLLVILEASGLEETYTGPEPLRLTSIERYLPTTQVLTKSGAIFKLTFENEVVDVAKSDFEIKAGGANGIISNVQKIGGNKEVLVSVSNIEGELELNLDIASTHQISDNNGNTMLDVSPIGIEQTYIGVNAAPELITTESITIYEGDDLLEYLKFFDLESDEIDVEVKQLPSWVSYYSDYVGERVYNNPFAGFKPYGFDVSPKGDLYITGREEGNRIKVFKEGDGWEEIFIKPGQTSAMAIKFLELYNHPSNIISSVRMDSEGSLYVSFLVHDVIFKLDNQGQIVSQYDLPVWGQEIRFAPNGDLIIMGGMRVGKIGANGIYEVITGTGKWEYLDGPVETAELNPVTDAAVDQEGNIYFIDNIEKRIRKIGVDGLVTTIAGNGETGFSDATGLLASFSDTRNIEINSKGELLLLDLSPNDEDNDRLRKINSEGQVTTYSALEGGKQHVVNQLAPAKDFVTHEFYEMEIDDGDTLWAVNYKADIWRYYNSNWLEGDTDGQLGLHKVILELTDNRGAVRNQEIAINVLSKTPKLLKVERSDPLDEVFEQDGGKMTFKLTFDRAINAKSTDFQIKGEHIETQYNGVDFPATAIEDALGQKYSNEITVTMTVKDGFGLAELEIRENNGISSLLHKAPMVDLAPSELNETYTVLPKIPEVSNIFNPTGREGGVGLDFVPNMTISNGILLLTGTADKGALVKLYVKGTGYSEVFETISHVGTWRLQVNTDEIGNGYRMLSFQAFSNDSDNLESNVSNTTTLFFDLEPPEEPTVSIDEDTGIDATDGITQDNDLIFYGTAEENSTIEYFSGFGYKTVATTDADGNWSYNHPTTLAEGDFEFYFRARDSVNNGGTPLTYNFTVDNTPPEKPLITGISEDLGLSDSDLLTSDNLPEVRGTAEANTLVDLLLDGVVIKEDIAVDNAGDWVYQLTGTALTDGSHEFTATATDIAGNTSTESSGLSIEIDTNVDAPQVSPVVGEMDVLPSANVVLTFNEDVHVGTGNIVIKQKSDDSVLETIDVTGGQVSISGHEVTIDPSVSFTPPSAELYITMDAGVFQDDAGNDYAGMANNTDWTFTVIASPVVISVDVPADDTYAVNEELGFTVNFSQPVTITGTPSIDVTIGPTVRTATLSGTVTNSATATFTYTILEDEVDADGIVLGSEVNLNGGTIQDAFLVDAILALNSVGSTSVVLVEAIRPVPTISSTANDPINVAFDIDIDFTEDITGLELTDLSIVNGTASNLTGSGSAYTVTITPLADGPLTIDLAADLVQDLVGNGNVAATQFSIQADVTAPNAPVISAVSDDTGSDTADATTNDNTLNFTGTGEANSTLELFIDGNSIGTTTVDGAGSWSFNHTSTTLTDAGYSVTATATDEAGNTSPVSAALALTVDSTAPVAPVISGITDDTGVSNSDGITHDNALVISGTAEANSNVEVFIDAASIGTVTANGSGNWSIDHSSTSLPDGDYVLTAQATDLAGNTSTASADFNTTVDTAAPAAPVVVSITTDTGTDAADQITNDQTLVFAGTAEANSSVEVFIDAGSIGTTTADGAGNWTYDHSGTLLTEASYAITAKATDAAGNVSTESTTLTTVVDITAPEVTSIDRISPTDRSVNVGIMTFKVVFSEAVVNVSVTEFEIISGLGITATISNVTQNSASEYEVTVSSISGDGLLRIRNKSTTSIADLAGNGLSNQIESEEAFSYDTAQPSVTISSTESSPTVANPVPVSICFDRPVSGFDASDIVVTNATTGTLTATVAYTYDWTVGSLGTAQGQFDTPRGVAVDASGHVYIVDRNNNRLQKFDESGTFIAEVGSLGSGAGAFDNPFGVAVGPLGNVYVLDTNNDRIQVFDASLNYLFEFGQSGNSGADGEFSFPFELAVDGQGRVFVGDFTRKDIQVFDANGNFLFVFDNQANGGFNLIGGMSFDAQGNVYVSDFGLDKVMVFDANGNYQLEFGGSGTGPGQFGNNLDIAVAGDFVFVSDVQLSRIQYFDLSGTYLGELDAVAAGGGALSGPVSMAVSDKYELYIADQNNHHVQKFDLMACYSTTLTPLAGGTITVDVAQAVAQDEFGNTNQAAAQFSIYYNNVPSDVILSATSILENNAIDDVVATLTTTDADGSDTHTYALVAGAGDTDNASFTISGDQLLAAEEYDLETKGSYDIRLMTTDNHGSSFEKVYTITIDNVPEAFIRIENGDVDGPTPLGISTNFDVTIHNDGDAALIVSNIVYPSPFGGPVTGISVAPFGSEVVTMTFTPTAAQTYTGEIDIFSNGGDRTITITATGAVVTDIDNGNIDPSSVEVYPNPADQLLTIDLKAFNGRPVEISLFDMNGSRAYQTKDYRQPTIELNVGNYQQGLYLLRLTEGTQIVQKKVLIKR